MKLLIHHHAPAYQDAEGIYVQSFIGNWVSALSAYYDEIGLLLPETKSKSQTQDTLVNASNIKLFPLPTGGKRWDYFHRKKQIAATCRSVSPHFDVLLVRGITPRQWTVWQACAVPQKAFLLVGSLLENRPKFGWTVSKCLTWVLNKVRRWEFRKMARDGFLLANSPQLVMEVAKFGFKAKFVPTNTVRESQIPPMQLRDISRPYRLLFCGRVVPDKGIEDLIIALGLIQKQNSVANKLCIIGQCTDEYKERLTQLAQKHLVGEQLDWKGFIPFGKALLQAYREADFLVLPSYHEGFPHCIWEAAVNSVPVLTTKVGGIPGLMDNTMVTFIKKRSPSDIADKIAAVHADKAIRWERVEKLYRFSIKFTVEAAANDLAVCLGTLGMKQWKMYPQGEEGNYNQ